ncbi:hypothetical protein KIH39_00540 [Telmatocola sphagniphila]|uniref:Uncharacterized protein n=1 Tax=Telmatocola sphagniphila TaxID=1123043 RepID=A0A8E6B700_9BACT|nr:hypothetical protein [Telmatocola sphagniphila]QVL32439.1 hypothetical protein KIH39_00540 [Telmatocola sphagniphila]
MFEPKHNQLSTETNKAFRFGKQILTIGIGSLVCFGMLGSIGVLAVVLDLDDSIREPVLLAVVVGSICTFLSLIGLYLTISYYRQRLIISASSVRLVGCFQTREVNLLEVYRAIWDTSGSITLLAQSRRLNIPLASYEGRIQIIQFLRANLPVDIQVGWEKFEWRYVPNGLSLWRRRRQLGRTHFVWLEGVFLGFCIGVCLLFREWLNRPLDCSLTVSVLLVLSVGGYLAGSYRWRKNEAAYLSLESHQPL